MLSAPIHVSEACAYSDFQAYWGILTSTFELLRSANTLASILRRMRASTCGNMLQEHHWIEALHLEATLSLAGCLHDAGHTHHRISGGMSSTKEY